MIRLNTWTISKVILLGAFAILTLVPQFAAAAEPYAVTVEHGVAVTMRDGTVLRADIYRPVAPGRFPVLLTRTPYDKHSDGDVDFGHKGAARGYVVINQDVRGRYTSDGEWYPFFRNPTTATTPSNGRRHCLIPMAESECMEARMSELPRCWLRLHIRRISREYVRS